MRTIDLKRLCGTLILALCCVAASALTAGETAKAATEKTPSATQEALVDEILELAGLTQAVDAVPAQIEQAISDPEGDYSKLPEQQRERLRGIMAEAFDPQRLLADIKKTMHERFAKKRYEAVRALLKSADGRRLTALEAQLAVPEVQENLRQFAADLQASPPPASRQKLIVQLDRASLTSETMLDISLASFGAVVLASGEIGQQDSKALKKALAAMRERLRPVVADQTALLLLYIYRDVAEAELKNFIRLYRQKDMAAMSGVIRQGIVRAMDNAFQLMLQRLRDVHPDELRA